jgi:alpha-glucoside transport system substrate-binding protein
MRLARVLVTLAVTAVPLACGAAATPDSTVTVMIPWDKQTDPSEYDAFVAVTDQFTAKYHIKVTLQTARAESQQLNADLAPDAGVPPPDVVDFPHPADLYPYLKHGLRPIQVSLQHYSDPWRGLAMLGTGTVYAVPVKADVQSLIWYPTAVKQPPATWEALAYDSRLPGTPWCLGLRSGAVSGWPGTYWIANLLLSMYGAGAYQDWIRGTLHWDSLKVSHVWQEWGTLLGNGTSIPGGRPGALETPFNKALATGHCEFEVGALAASGLASMTGYGYARFPAVSGGPSPILVSGDFMGQFTGNPNAATLLRYLASDEAQAIWVQQPLAHALSADKNVPSASYPAGVERGLVGLLRDPGTLCFSPGALMTTDMNAAFNQAVLEYINAPGSLPGLLKGLQLTQEGVGASPLKHAACSRSGASS